MVLALLSKLLGRPISIGWQLLLIWGGLRGAIAIALVLSLPTSLPYWWTIQSMVFGVVVFSLLVQGTSNKYWVRSLSSR
ncbi:cation:proton antiporter [Spongiibacter sp.]|uniref:cation:proton antiporter domain-containing protein n=1 Tax=Spongiibacter sp. TaxID=2024860 RepID=UPI00356628DD